MEFKDKVAIVTGGSSGIGFGISKKLAEQGTKVYLVARNIDKLENARSKILEDGGKAEILSADITDFRRVKEVIDQVYDENGHIDILVNNAGDYRGASLDVDFENVAGLIDLDFKAHLGITHYAIQKFKDKLDNPLMILTVLSHAALKLLPGGAVYGGCKIGLMHGLFHYENELKGKDHIKFYRLYPRTTGTESVIEYVRKGIFDEATSLESVVDAAMDLLAGRTPTRDVEVGYEAKKGIIRRYFDVAQFFPLTKEAVEQVMDPDFDPKKDLK